MAKSFSTADLNKKLGFQKLQERADPRKAYRTKDIPQPLLDALLASNAHLLPKEK